MIAALRATFLSALFAVSALAGPYPAGSVTRTYRGDLRGSFEGLIQSGTGEAELTILSESNGVTYARVRGRFVDAPLVALVLDDEWSNYVDVWATGFPFRADAAWDDGTARVFAQPAADWSAIELAASGSVVGASCTLERTTIRLVSTVTNGPAPVASVTNDAGGHASNVVQTATNGPVDAIELVEWRGLGTHAKVDPRRARITRELYEAHNNGKDVSLTFEPLGWRSEGSGKRVDGRVYILWQEGTSYTGGHFDWHGVGQTRKTQDNIPGGYLDHKEPPSGAPVWYCILDLDGRERTNITLGGTW